MRLFKCTMEFFIFYTKSFKTAVSHKFLQDFLEFPFEHFICAPLKLVSILLIGIISCHCNKPLTGLGNNELESDVN